MAYGFVNLSKKKRNYLFIVIVVIHVIQIILGISIVAVSVDFKSTGKYVHSEDTANINAISSIITVFGCHLLLIHFIGLRTSFKTIKESYRKATKILINIWIATGLGMSINGIICASLALRTAEKLTQKLRESMSRGMGQYLSDPTWRKIFNDIQQSLKCCGIDNFIDWHQKPWIHMEYLLGDSETVLKYAEPDARMLPPVTPWSCCRISSKTPCFHDPLQQSQFKEVWADPHESLPSIYHTGCLTVLSRPIEGTLFSLIFLNVFTFLLQVTLVVLMRLLYTSTRNAVLMGNSNEIAPGWILGRGDFKLRGHPLSEFIKSKRSHDVIADLTLRPDEATEFETDGDSSPLPTTSLHPKKDYEGSPVSDVDDNGHLIFSSKTQKDFPSESSLSRHHLSDTKKKHKHDSSKEHKHTSHYNDEIDGKDNEIEDTKSLEKMSVIYEDETASMPSTSKHDKVKKHRKHSKTEFVDPYLNPGKSTKKFHTDSEDAEDEFKKNDGNDEIPKIPPPKFNLKQFNSEKGSLSKVTSKESPSKFNSKGTLPNFNAKKALHKVSSKESPSKITSKGSPPNHKEKKPLSDLSLRHSPPKLSTRNSAIKFHDKEKLKESKKGHHEDVTESHKKDDLSLRHSPPKLNAKNSPIKIHDKEKLKESKKDHHEDIKESHKKDEILHDGKLPKLTKPRDKSTSSVGVQTVNLVDKGTQMVHHHMSK